MGKEKKMYLLICTHSANETFPLLNFIPVIAWALREMAVVLHKILLLLTYMQMLVPELQRTEQEYLKSSLNSRCYNNSLCTCQQNENLFEQAYFHAVKYLFFFMYHEFYAV